jgi:hypothetical protein
MTKPTSNQLQNLWIGDRKLQNEAFGAVIEATHSPVDWAYEVWDEAVANLTHKDNHNRAIAAQVLCSLAKSDPEKRILQDFKALLNVTRDERFVTARHCMQALWKVGAAGDEQRALLLEGLERRYKECIDEKNWSLIRFDIIKSLRDVYETVEDERVMAKALELIELEEDAKYKKKYAKVWKDVSRE